MLSDRTLELAIAAQETALRFMARDPHGNHEIGRRAFDVAQRIVDQWGKEQTDIYRKGKT